MKKGRFGRGWQSQRRIIRLHDETYFGAVDAANHGSRRSDGIRRGEPTGGQHRLLTTSDTEPLSIMQLGYLMAEDYSAASVVGTILVGLGVLLALVVRKSRYQFGIQEG